MKIILSALWILLTGGGLYFSSVHAEEIAVKNVHFSSGRLKALGIDPSVAAYFSTGGHFSPGITEAELQINGRSLGMQKLRFGHTGDLCADEDFFSSAGILQSSKKNNISSLACPALRLVWPSATVSLNPASQEVNIVVPPEALVKVNDMSHFQQGGSATLLNYSAFSSHYDFYGKGSDFSYLNLESGFNYGGWMVRGSHSINQDSIGDSNFKTAYIYAQKTMVERKQLFQAGQINFSNSLLSGAAIDGIQIIPQNALNSQSNGVKVSGISPADQSRVEVKQNGIQVYATLVPAGPFTLTDIPLLNSSSDLLVTVISPDGQQDSFTVTAASFRRLVPQAPESASLAMGRLRAEGIGSSSGQQWVASLSDGWGLTNNVLLESGVMTTSNYLNGGAGITVSPQPELAIGVSGALSQDRNHGFQGSKSATSFSWNAPLNFNFGGDVTFYSPGYRELIDSVSPFNSSYSRTSAGLRMGWNNALVGRFSISASQTRQNDRQNDKASDIRRFLTAWSKTTGSVTTSVNWQRQSGSVSHCRTNYQCRNKIDRDSLFLNFSFPLGSSQAHSYYRNTPNSVTTGLQTSGNITENSTWSISAERNLKNEIYNSVSASLNSNLHYANVGVYGAKAGNKTQSYSGTVSGGIVANKEGLIFSPYKINDTFGIVSVEPATSGIEFMTPQGKVWTDWRGKALAPALPAYGLARIELNTEKLPDNMDVSNGLRQLVAGHGAVLDTHFSLQQTRNGLMTVKLADGTLLPKGSVITTEDDQYVTTAVDTGSIFITDLNDRHSLIAHWQDKSCRIDYIFSGKAPEGIGYENINAKCVQVR